MTIHKAIECDLLVIGGGAAGCGAAIKARDLAERVVLVDKGKVGRSGLSPYVAGVWDLKFPEDDTDVWVREIIQHGEYLSDQEWTKIWVENIYSASMELDEWGKQYRMRIFEKDDKGNFIRRKARSHVHTSTCLVNAIPMMDTLRKKAQEKGVVFIERTVITDLLICNGRVVGATGFNYRTGDIYLFKAKAVVAAGGRHSFGRVFLMEQNLAGDLIAEAYVAGAVMYKFDMVVSNTCARDFGTHGMNLIVASGGRFLNAKGEEFAWNYEPEVGNRAKLSILTIAFCNEVKEGRGPIYLDMSRASPEDIQIMRKLLPESFATWDRSGIDFSKDKIPWIPAMCGGGGMRINTRCETSLPGLYAAGDDTGRPQAGTTTIGGGNIPFAFLSGLMAGHNAAESVTRIKDVGWDKAELDAQVQRAINIFTAPLDRQEGIQPEQVIQNVQRVIVPWPVGYIKNEKRLRKALAEIERIRHEEIPSMKCVDFHGLVKAKQANSLGIIAELTLKSALFRKESRGYHYREDYPYTDNENWLKWIMVKKENGEARVWGEDVPTPYISPSEPMSIPPGVKRTKAGAE